MYDDMRDPYRVVFFDIFAKNALPLTAPHLFHASVSSPPWESGLAIGLGSCKRPVEQHHRVVAQET